MKKRTLEIAATLAAIVALTACGTGVASTGAASVTTTTVEAATTSQPSATSEATTAKVSANSASVSEIAAALAGAGVDNAERWAGEVVEYRPYDIGDPDLTHLRDELAKYNPAPGVVDLIVSVLEP
jgi:DNA uptake protein ComE-like DNA-binding protein